MLAAPDQPGPDLTMGLWLTALGFDPQGIVIKNVEASRLSALGWVQS